MLFARTLGIRDLFLGLGALTASGDAELKRWSSICLASDVADLAAGATASRHVGRSGAVAAAGAPIPFIAAGAWAIRRLMQSARATEA